MFRLRSQGRIFPVLVAVVLVGLSFIEFGYGRFKQPAGTSYTFLHNYPEDFFYYLHVIRQGIDGNILVTSRMTPETFGPQFTVTFFVLLGWIGRITGLTPVTLYTAARLIGGLALVWAIWLLTERLFHDRRERLASFVLTLTGSFLPIIQDGRLAVATYVKAWTELDPLARLTYIPHHLWSKVLLVFLILLLTQRATGSMSARRNTLLAVGFGVLLMGFTSPVIIVTFAVTVLLFAGGEWLASRNAGRGAPWSVLNRSAAALAGAAAVVAYHWQLSHSTFPWTTYGPPWENNWLYLYSA